MVGLPSTINKNDYVFGYKSVCPSDAVKFASYVPFVSTLIAFDRMLRAYKNTDHISLASRVAHFARAALEIVPFVNMILVPIDLAATILIKASQKTHIFDDIGYIFSAYLSRHSS